MGQGRVRYLYGHALEMYNISINQGPIIFCVKGPIIFSVFNSPPTCIVFLQDDNTCGR